MSEPAPADLYSVPMAMPIKVTYTDDSPDVRQWLQDLRRDLLRKVRQIDELISRLPIDS